MPKELPKYKCHKVVSAAKIGGFFPLEDGDPNGGVRLTFSDGEIPPLVQSKEWREKHQPVEGGYLVAYADGYVSFSPARAFEEGYSLVTGSEDLPVIDLNSFVGALRALKHEAKAFGDLEPKGTPAKTQWAIIETYADELIDQLASRASDSPGVLVRLPTLTRLSLATPPEVDYPPQEVAHDPEV